MIARRPLCVVCVLLMIGILIIHFSGFLTWTDVEKLPLGARMDGALCSGILYRIDVRDDTTILYLEQAVLSADSKQIPIKNIRITLEQKAVPFHIGNTVQMHGDMKPIAGPSNPGQFDSALYYAIANVGWTAWEPEVTRLRSDIRPLRSWLDERRRDIGAVFDECLSEEHASVAKAMVLGDKSDLSLETKSQYQMSGISHMLAISGLHLTLLGMGLYHLLRRCGVGLYGSGCVSILLLAVYTVFTGAGVATVRALIMFALAVTADMMGRTYDVYTSLATAAILILLDEPLYLFYSGFRLSFVAVLGLATAPKGKGRLRTMLHLTLMMLPVIAYDFFEIPIFNIPVNLLVVPTMAVVLIGSIAGGLIGMASVAAGRIAMAPVTLLLTVYDWISTGVQRLPFAAWITGRPALWQIVVYYAVFAVGCVMPDRVSRCRRWVRGSVHLIPVLAVALLLLRLPEDFSLTFLDVGQGDGIVITTDTGVCYLMDGGSSSTEHVGQYRIMPYLKSRGIRTIRCAMISHTDADHMNGIIEILAAQRDRQTTLRIESIALPKWGDTNESYEELSALAKSVGIPLYKLRENDVIREGETILRVLHPDGETDYGENTNDGSVVIRLEQGAFSALLTGDLSQKEEMTLPPSAWGCTLLKVGHHGSRHSTSEGFLEAVHPQIAILSYGANNRYGHPHEEVVTNLQEHGVSVKSTAVDGAITVKVNNTKVDLYSFRLYN